MAREGQWRGKGSRRIGGKKRVPSSRGGKKRLSIIVYLKRFRGPRLDQRGLENPVASRDA
jgi:hypothetical protein